MKYRGTLSALVLLLARAQLASAQSAEAPPAAVVPPLEPVALASPTPHVGNEPLESGPQPIQGKWATTFYGFVEFDALHDSTQPGLTSINDSQGNAALARPGTYQASNGQTLFGARNSPLRNLQRRLQPLAYHRWTRLRRRALPRTLVASH